MQIIEGSFGKKDEPAKRPLIEKIHECLENLGGAAEDPEANTGFVLITEVDNNVYIASDMTVDEFIQLCINVLEYNFMLDTAKMNILLSSTMSMD